MVKQTDRLIDIQTERQIDRQTDRQIDNRQMDSWIDIQMDRWMDGGLTDRWIDSQTERGRENVVSESKRKADIVTKSHIFTMMVGPGRFLWGRRWTPVNGFCLSLEYCIMGLLGEPQGLEMPCKILPVFGYPSLVSEVGRRISRPLCELFMFLMSSPHRDIPELSL